MPRPDPLTPALALLALLWAVVTGLGVLTLAFAVAGILWLLGAAVVALAVCWRRWTSWHVTTALAVLLAGGIGGCRL